MPEFGPTVYVWRVERGLTQAVLAQRAGLPRPTVSALERGALDPTLRTIRRVAAGLGVQSGLLVDGTLPPRFRTGRLSRASLERIVAHLQGGPARLRAPERLIASLLREILTNRLALLRAQAEPCATTARTRRRHSARRAQGHERAGVREGGRPSRRQEDRREGTLGSVPGARHSARRAQWSWLALGALLKPQELQGIVSRLEKRSSALP